MARLLVIRHVEVELRDGVPPEEWLPTPAGLEAAASLAREPFVRELTLVATSPEAKAVASARPAAPLRPSRTGSCSRSTSATASTSGCGSACRT